MSTDFICQLGPVEFTVMPGGDFGQVLQQLAFGAPARADVPRLAMVRSDMTRTFSFPALISAGSKDEAIANVSAANRALSVSNTLVVRSVGASNSVTFRTFPSGSVRQLPVQEWEVDSWQTVEVTLTVEPYAYGDPVTDVHTVAAPCALDLASLPGEYSAPIAVEVAIVDSGDKLHSCYLALNEHPEWDGWLTAAHTLSWTNASEQAATAVAYDDAEVYTTGTDRAYADLATEDVPPGDYLVLVRAKMGGASSGTIDIAGAARWSVTVPATCTTYRYFEVGDLALPYSLVRSSAVSPMQLGLTSTSASNHLIVDQIVLLPYRAGYQSWHPGTTYDSASYWYERVYFDDDGTAYLEDVCHLEDITGAPIKSLAGEVLLLVDEKDGDTNHTHLTATVMQTPRFSLYR
jgi:hypothetical protein